MTKQPVVPFTFESHNIRALNINSDPWFVAQDVCSVLGIQNVTQAIERLDDDERSMFNIGRQGVVNIVNESGMYTLVLRCRDAVKKGSVPHRFRKWVTAEVLPSIRKNGVYAKPKVRQCTAKQLTPLRQTAERLITTGLGKIYPDIWKLVHQHFEVDHIHQLTPPQVAEAVEYLNVLEGEYLGKQQSPEISELNIHFPITWWNQHEYILRANGCSDFSHTNPCRFPVKMLFGLSDSAPSAISALLFNLAKAGYDVSAARLEHLAHRHYAEIMYYKIENINKSCSSIINSNAGFRISPSYKP
ncbi:MULTISPECIES: BRO-N domain-containing protein [Limnobaculum]|uniref:BRO-N domain-containing protein n=1 Tax=Limnobaculum TaxID=2172100 RepID=UPI001E35909B|nr:MULTISPECIES: BRO family protein [Limnobaculum]